MRKRVSATLHSGSHIRTPSHGGIKPLKASRMRDHMFAVTYQAIAFPCNGEKLPARLPERGALVLPIFVFGHYRDVSGELQKPQ
jgi:hypothetical protein